MSRSLVDALDTLEPAERLARLIDRPEDQWFERKSARVAPKDLAKALVAFANAEGGSITVGIHSGTLDSRQLTATRENSLRQASMDFTVPPVRTYIHRVNVGSSDDETLLLFEVPPGETVHETTSGEVYLRVGDESKKLSFHQRKELDYDRGAAHFEAEPARDHTLDDLDQPSLEDYCRAIDVADAERALRARSLLTRGGTPTVAAVLLMGQDPQLLLPQSFVRVLRFTEDDAGSGRHHTLESGHDARFEGPIPAVIDAASACIGSWVPQRRALGRHGRFEDIPSIPPDAWLEGLVNAVVHRSYSMAGDHVRVSIYPRRIEIESPGRFPGLANPNQPLEVARYARNPRIARVCADLGITLERGEGIRRMFQEMRTSGLVDPHYEQTSGSVRLILQNVSRLEDNLRDALPMGADDVLELMRRVGRPMGTGEIAEATGRSRPWVRGTLESLRDSGLIRWQGKSAKDPRAQWSLAPGMP